MIKGGSINRNQTKNQTIKFDLFKNVNSYLTSPGQWSLKKNYILRITNLVFLCRGANYSEVQRFFEWIS